MSSVKSDIWNALDHGPSPFLEHGFLRALEESGSVGAGTGWQPAYLLAEDAAGTLLGAVVAYVKTHSYGEYIFDWAWANASERAGLPYYPKLVVHVPATPATGNRILLAPGVDRELITTALAAGVRELADQAECSSIHWLFVSQPESARLAKLGFTPRASYQFHFHNRGYGDFDEFLATLTSRKRKQIRRERRQSREAVDDVVFVPGRDLSGEQVRAMERYYRATCNSHWGSAYLSPSFFDHLVAYCPERVVFADARRGGRSIAGALYLETEHALYGRYWGFDEHVDFLHFEVAYYAGIERCIERDIRLFEAGAQGQHKLLRGFMPSPTYSNHWIRHPGLAQAIDGFLAAEADEVAHHIRQLSDAAPYRKDS